jgi:hypothetical protein|nr:MAG: hypothetical protein [Bacteriophage sp.]
MNTFSPLSYCDNNNNKKTTCLFNGDKRMTIFICQHCGREYEGATVCASDDCPGNEIKMPVLVEVWSVDSLAECLDAVGPELHRKLWSFVPAEGESPKGKDIWHLLSEDEQRELVDAVHIEFPDDED